MQTGAPLSPSIGTPGLQPLAADPHSYAQPEEARVTHVALDLTPDFAARRLAGTARLTIARAAGADSIVLDVRDLTIKRIADAQGSALGYRIGSSKEFHGAPLSIALPRGDVIVVEYETSPAAAAVQWSRACGWALPSWQKRGGDALYGGLQGQL